MVEDAEPEDISFVIQPEAVEDVLLKKSHGFFHVNSKHVHAKNRAYHDLRLAALAVMLKEV